MDVYKYLKRIDFTGVTSPDVETLARLHEHHVYHVPFENLDVRYKRPFNLDRNLVFDKVVTRRRGGFCYELNSLFNELLKDIGFNSRMIAGRVFNEHGLPGPEYDHMSVYIKTDKEYLADVGFGELMIRPIEIKEGVQTDGRAYFKIERQQDDYLLSMSYDGNLFENKYSFSLKETALEDFVQGCMEKQVSPDSYFVKNTICTKATTSGRITIFNDKLIERNDKVRTETIIVDDDQLRQELFDKFEIRIEK